MDSRAPGAVPIKVLLDGAHCSLIDPVNVSDWHYKIFVPVACSRRAVLLYAFAVGPHRILDVLFLVVLVVDMVDLCGDRFPKDVVVGFFLRSVHEPRHDVFMFFLIHRHVKESITVLGQDTQAVGHCGCVLSHRADLSFRMVCLALAMALKFFTISAAKRSSLNSTTVSLDVMYAE